MTRVARSLAVVAMGHPAAASLIEEALATKPELRDEVPGAEAILAELGV